MGEIKTFEYGTHKIRMTEMEDKVWWSLNDVCKVLGVPSNNAPLKVAPCDKRLAPISNTSAIRMNYVTQDGICKFVNHYYTPEVAKFKKWLDSKPLSERTHIESKPQVANLKTSNVVTPPLEVTKPSVEAGLQKAAMLVRIAEHKALPKDEQVRLLDLAVRELTGHGLDLTKPQVINIPSAKRETDNKNKAAVQNKTLDFNPDIMSVPEIQSSSIQYPLSNYANAAACADIFGISLAEFNKLVDKYSLKNFYTGYWKFTKRNGKEFREFIFIIETVINVLERFGYETVNY